MTPPCAAGTAGRHQLARELLHARVAQITLKLNAAAASQPPRTRCRHWRRDDGTREALFRERALERLDGPARLDNGTLYLQNLHLRKRDDPEPELVEQLQAQYIRPLLARAAGTLTDAAELKPMRTIHLPLERTQREPWFEVDSHRQI